MAERGIGLALIALLVLVGLTVFVKPTSCDILDADKDGIPDDVERTLLEKYRPYFRFTSGEDYRPCDPIWYVRRCELLTRDCEEDPTAIAIRRSDLEKYPDRLLYAREEGDAWGSSDITKNPRKTAYYLNPENSARHGPDWSEVLSKKNVGLFGHVVRWQRFYKIEYWQFFGYNDAEHAEIGDHEGDWASVQLLLDPVTGWLVRAFHYAHGKEMRFDFTVDGVSRILLDGDVMEFRGPNFGSLGYDINAEVEWYERGWYCNNLVRFYRDPATGEYVHPLVYIERNSHEFWPSEHWRYGVQVAGNTYYAPGHAGDGYTFLTETPPNLGEVENPSYNYPFDIIMRYNGRWGTFGRANSPPPGPALHWEWGWPATPLRFLIQSDSFEDGGCSFKDVTPPALDFHCVGSWPSRWTNDNRLRATLLEVRDDGCGFYGYWVSTVDSAPAYSCFVKFPAGPAYEYVSDSLLEGDNYYLYVWAADNYGNMKKLRLGPTGIDRTPPGTPTVRELQCGSGWQTHNSPFFTWNNPGDNPGGSGFDHYEISIDGSISWKGDAQYHLDWADGAHIFRVRVVDEAGNQGAWSIPLTVMIDTTRPTVPTLYSPPDRTVTGDQTPTLCWNTATDTGSGVASYALEIDSTLLFKSRDLRRITGISYRLDYTPDTPLPAGTWYWRVRAVDKVGWLSDYSTPRTITIEPFDFSLSNSGSVTVHQGASGFSTITITLTVGTGQGVTLSTSGLPSGVTASFNPTSGTPPFTSRCTISASRTASPGTYQVRVVGSGGGQTHTTGFVLKVTATPSSSACEE